MIIKLTSSISLEHLYLAEVGFYSCEGVIYEVRVFAGPGTVSDDFTVKEIHQDINVIPFVVYPNVGQVAYDSGVQALSVKLLSSLFGMGDSLHLPVCTLKRLFE